MVLLYLFLQNSQFLNCIALNFTHIGQEIWEVLGRNLFTPLSTWANFHETSACILTVCK